MKTNCTSGKWVLRQGDADNHFEILGPYGSNKTIACLPNKSFIDTDEAEANAKLIAAAPELLSELQHFIERIENVILMDKTRQEEDPFIIGFVEALRDRANDVIKKATE